MKLRKTLDKAKKDRGEITPSPANLDVPEEKKGERPFKPIFTEAARQARILAKKKEATSTLSSPENGILER